MADASILYTTQINIAIFSRPAKNNSPPPPLPKQATFSAGQTEVVVQVPVVHDNTPNEGCETVTVGVTAVSGNGSAVVTGGIHDVAAQATVMIEEDDFTSAVLETGIPVGLETDGGGLSPATAEVRLNGKSNGADQRIQQPMEYGLL